MGSTCALQKWNFTVTELSYRPLPGTRVEPLRTVILQEEVMHPHDSRDQAEMHTSKASSFSVFELIKEEIKGCLLMATIRGQVVMHWQFPSA
jgi:hypothetical protein